MFMWVLFLTNKDMCLKEIGLCAQNMLTILSSVVNNTRGGHIEPLHEHENLCFDYGQDIHISSKNYEANGSGHDVDWH